MANPIPKEMQINGRMPDPVFEPDERLYIRFNIISLGKVDVSCIRCPSQSVNRSKYSEPHWVLISVNNLFDDWGYGYFKVNDVPQILESPGGSKFYQNVEHVPLEHNYPHSEVRSYKDSGYKNIVKNMNNHKTALKFRHIIRNRTFILENGSGTTII